MSKASCFISDNRTCEPVCPDNLVFIIGSGSSEFDEDVKVILDVLKNFGFEGYFALLSEKEKGLDSFCDKICSKILGSQFCVVLLNDPIISIEKYADSAKNGVVLRGARPNVYYEYGIAVAASKNIIPLMRRDMKLPFDVQHLDAILYGHPDELRTKLMAVVQETREKPIKRRFVKEPNLDLLLLDSEGNTKKSIHTKPIYERIKRVKRKSKLMMMNPAIEATLKVLNGLTPLRPEIRPDDIVQIGISITNKGEAPATNIRIFLTFPPECELIPESRFTFGAIAHVANPKSGGLYTEKS